MNRTLTFVKIAAWAWTVAIYCCLAERISLALWMSCSPAQAMKSLSCLLSLENGLGSDHLCFFLMPYIIWLLHRQPSVFSTDIVRCFVDRFTESEKSVWALITVQMLLTTIALAALPTITGAGGQALAFAAVDTGCYRVGERIFHLSMTADASRLGRSLLWYRGQMDKGRRLDQLAIATVATVYGTHSRQLKAFTLTPPTQN